jgi:SAM-dependent methyltransferase
MAGRYSFGDSDLAVRRLRLVAEVFEPTSRALLSEAIPDEPDTALDLGCGPGHTTRLLAEVARPHATLGLDGSERYVETARATTDHPAVSYACHDVTQVPLPAAPADVIYARLLLAHLPDPLAMAEQWRGQLAAGGVLVLEEVEAIDPPAGVLEDYEDLVVKVVAARGGGMYAGPRLAGLGGTCIDLDVDTALAARMFGLNLATWSDDARSRGLAGRAELHRLAEGLASLVEAGPGQGTVRWVIRQLAVPAGT